METLVFNFHEHFEYFAKHEKRINEIWDEKDNILGKNPERDIKRP